MCSRLESPFEVRESGEVTCEESKSAVLYSPCYSGVMKDREDGTCVPPDDCAVTVGKITLDVNDVVVDIVYSETTSL